MQAVLPEAFTERIKPYILNAELDLYEAYSVTSTNDWAWEHYEHAQKYQVVRPSLFLAETQQSGRGTAGRKWHSPVGSGIYGSILFPVHHQSFATRRVANGVVPMYTSIAGLATWIVLTSIYPSLSPILQIRGVNDLYAKHAKVGGILVETRLSTEGVLKSVVTGIGLNLHKNPDLKIMDERHCPMSIEELLPPDERKNMMNRKQTAYLVGKCMVGLYQMLNKGLMPEYENVVDCIRGRII
jgi:BirA family biotin operon repressor/biotin-[acetyl-CoA-carboxylase] ligase